MATIRIKEAFDIFQYSPIIINHNYQKSEKLRHLSRCCLRAKAETIFRLTCTPQLSSSQNDEMMQRCDLSGEQGNSEVRMIMEGARGIHNEV
jgi:hypothetical protein